MMSDPFDLSDFSETPAAPSADTSYLDGLNPEQRQAVEATEGPVLVLAGAGTGKTRVLTTRLAHLLNTHRAWPREILCVTFTNKASNEMKHRVERLIGQAVEGMPFLGTFHSVAARMLRYDAELVGLKPDFTIIDTDDQVRLLKQLIAAERIDDKRWPARVLAGHIDNWKNRGLTPDQVPESESASYADGKGGALYAAYQERLKIQNAADFGDLLLYSIEILKNHPDVLAKYHDRIKYIMVDEYQDTNVAQYLWLRLLAQARSNVCCVGDEDQSIYGWRGAEVGNILRFEKDFPGSQVVRLERNYRSTKHILGAASGLIEANSQRLGKTLWTDIEGGEKIVVRGVWDGPEEARVVAEKIDQIHGKGHDLTEIAILVRASFQTREFEERFNLLGIPYRLVGGVRFYERQEVRDAMGYLRVVARPDSDLAFERVVNLPKRGLGNKSLQLVHQLARAQQIPLTRAAKILIETDELRPQARKSLTEVMNNFERWRALLTEVPHPELAEIILDESGYTGMWQADKSVSAPGRLENLRELTHAMAEFENMDEFLDHVSLVLDNDQNSGGDRVNLMTLHSAKGLEFQTVFLPGWEEELFPHQRALDEGGDAALEEERRLAYVGLTRARERAMVLFAANRQVYGQWRASIPSGFVDELPDEHVERSSDDGLYQRTRPMIPPTPATRTVRRDTDDMDFDFNQDPEGSMGPGDQVTHPKFGTGRIVAVDGNKLEIDFPGTGRKKVIASFVQPL
jgi:DNA helicase II / ATP-dependent DNA helicase PcrA